VPHKCPVVSRRGRAGATPSPLRRTAFRPIPGSSAGADRCAAPAPRDRAVDKEALADEEDQQHRQADDHRYGHHERPLRPLALEESGEAELRRVFVLVRQDEEGPEEIVPARHELQDGDGGQRRARERQDDGAVDGEVGGTIEAGRLDKRLRDAQEELAVRRRWRR